MLVPVHHDCFRSSGEVPSYHRRGWDRRPDLSKRFTTCWHQLLTVGGQRPDSPPSGSFHRARSQWEPYQFVCIFHWLNLTDESLQQLDEFNQLHEYLPPSLTALSVYGQAMVRMSTDYPPHGTYPPYDTTALRERVLSCCPALESMSFNASTPSK